MCKACTLLEGLNRGLPRLGIGKSSRVKRLIAENDKKQHVGCCSASNVRCQSGISEEHDVIDDDIVDRKCLCRGINKGIDLNGATKLIKNLSL